MKSGNSVLVSLSNKRRLDSFILDRLTKFITGYDRFK